VCDALAAHAAAGLDLNHGIPAGARCGWSPSKWSPCSESCGGGITTRDYDCVCSGGGIVSGGLLVDATGEACRAIRPPDTNELCNTKGCPACTSIQLTPTAAANPEAVSIAGQYRRAGDGVDVPLRYNNRSHYVHVGGKPLHMYHVFAFERPWWVVGAVLGSSYGWSAYLESADTLPTMSLQNWFMLGPGSSLPGSQQLSSASEPGLRVINMLDQQCHCDQATLMPDPNQQGKSTLVLTKTGSARGRMEGEHCILWS
jgi:hypothetical protein